MSHRLKGSDPAQPCQPWYEKYGGRQGCAGSLYRIPTHLARAPTRFFGIAAARCGLWRAPRALRLGREVLEQLVPSYLKESAAGLGEGCARAASTRNDSLLSCSAPRCAPWWPGSPPAAPGRAHLLHRHGRRPGTSRAVTAARPPRVGPDSRGPGGTPHRSGDRGMRYMGGGRGVLSHLAGAAGA